MKTIVKKDCFAYHKSTAGTESCKALKCMECYKCAFYKPKSEVQDSENKD